MADLRVKLDDHVYTLDPDSVTSREYKSIKSHTGLTMPKFWAAVMSADMDIEVFDALRWLFLKRGGITVDLFTDDDYSPADFLSSLVELNNDEEEAEDDSPKAPEAAKPTLS